MKTVEQLIHELQEMVDQDPTVADLPVMLATQPNYPMQHGILGPVLYLDEDRAEEIAHKELEGLPTDSVPNYSAVYLLEHWSRGRWPDGREVSPYASRSLWDEA